MKSVFITGASRGIGRACALRMARHNWRVFAGVRDPDAAAALQRDGPDTLSPVSIDVTDAASIAAAFNAVSEACGDAGLDALVNNAGIPMAGPLAFIPLELVEETLRVNVLGALAVTQQALPLLLRATGRVVNMSSVSGFVAVPFLGPYAASKHALEALSDALRVELRPWNIPVSVIQPGKIRTDIWQRAGEAAQPLRDAATPRQAADYGPILDAIASQEPGGGDPDTVAMVVERALCAKRPRARYRVGLDATLIRWFTRLPTPILDRIIVRRFPPYGS